MRTPLPHIISQAQIAARSDQSLKSLLLETMKELSTLTDLEKLHFVQQKIDSIISKENFETSCKKGCHYCCYHPITISNTESEVLNSHADKKDTARLKAQSEDYENCSYNDKACVFLKNGECSVYNDRPLICRLTYVQNEPQFCHLDNSEQEISHLPMTKASIIAGAYYMSCPDTRRL